MPISATRNAARPLTASAQRRKAPSGAAAGATAAMVSSSAAQPTLSDSAWLEIKGGSLSVCPMQEYAIALPSRDGALQSCFTCCKAGQHAR